MNDPDDNPFWGEPTPTDLWEDMAKLNEMYEKLGWSLLIAFILIVGGVAFAQSAKGDERAMVVE